MKILWLSPTPSHPQNEGNRAHIFQLGKKILAAGHEVIFLLYNQEGALPQEIEEMRLFWPHLFVLPHLKTSRVKTQGEAWGIDDWFNTDIESAVRFLQQDCDCIICEYIFMSKALTLVPSNVIKILNCHSCTSDRDSLLKSCDIPTDFFYTTKEQEKLALQRADIVLAIQEEEKEFFQALADVKVLELGYLSSAISLPPRKPSLKLRIGLMGSDNSLNKRSTRQFFEALKEYPDIASCLETVIAGPLSHSFLQDADICLGTVHEEKEFFQQIDLFINPIVTGTGLKIKTVSAFQHNKPFLSTKAGSSGLPVRHACHQCSTPADFILYLRQLVDLEHRSEKLAILQKESEYLSFVYNSKQERLAQQFFHVLEHPKRPVLVVTDIPFWEEGVGSHSRIASLCKELKKHFLLHVFFLGSLYLKRMQAIQKLGFENIVFSYKDYEEQGKKIALSSTFPNYPGLQAKRHESFCRALACFLESRPKYQAVIFEYIWMAYLKDVVPYPALNILDTHDMMAFRKYALEGQFNAIDLSLREEVTLFNKFDAILLIQKEEYQAARKLNLKTIPLYCPHHVLSKQVEKPKRGVHFGFIGANNEVNFQAIAWFIENVWCLQTNPHATLHIFGNICQRLTTCPANVSLHGMMENKEEIYACCDIMVNPIVYGGGLKIKSMEALSFGKALLASPEAVRGIESPESSGILVAKSRQEFVCSMLWLSYDELLIEKLSRDALCAAEKQFSSTACYAHLIDLIESYA